MFWKYNFILDVIQGEEGVIYQNDSLKTVFSLLQYYYQPNFNFEFYSKKRICVLQQLEIKKKSIGKHLWYYLRGVSGPSFGSGRFHICYNLCMRTFYHVYFKNSVRLRIREMKTTITNYTNNLYRSILNPGEWPSILRPPTPIPLQIRPRTTP